jgi:hypothetical protein
MSQRERRGLWKTFALADLNGQSRADRRLSGTTEVVLFTKIFVLEEREVASGTGWRHVEFPTLRKARRVGHPRGLFELEVG